MICYPAVHGKSSKKCMPVADDLAASTIVVTRPAHQAENLCNLIVEYGGKVIRFPVLEISDPPVPLNSSSIHDALAAAKLVIFISPNAVDYGMKAAESAGGIPDAVKVAAIGQGTAKKLQQWQQPVDVFPSEKFDSEELLAMDELQQVDGQHIVIFRGVGGREHLADTLRQRGATVQYIECYQRVKPDVDSEQLSAALAAESVDAVIVTSNEGLQNLYDMLSPQDQHRLLNVQLFVVSERSRELAQTLGFSKTAIIVDKASDQGIVDSLLKWKQ